MRYYFSLKGLNKAQRRTVDELQNVLIKKYQRIERLVLGGRRYILVCRQPVQKLSDFSLGHVTGVAESMKAYEIANPVPVGLFGTQTGRFLDPSATLLMN